MSIVVRDVREHELDSVLALNNAAGPAILPLDSARLRHFYETAEYFRVAERDGTLAGFLIGVGSDADHDSRNFQWFRERYPRAFYADVQSHAELRYPLVTCEVFLEGVTDPVLLFHGSFGFREVGQRVLVRNGMRAAMLMKELCSYPWVRDTYGGNLPDVPWITTRSVLEAPPAPRSTGTGGP